MRVLLTSALLLLATFSVAQQPPAPAPSPQPTAEASNKPDCSKDAKTGVESCSVSKKDRKAAENYYKEGVKLEKKGQPDEAFETFKLATEHDPTNSQFLNARETLRQQLVRDALERGNKALSAGKTVIAMAEFRKALELDPSNDFVRQRVRDILGEIRLPTVQIVKDAPGDSPILVDPRQETHDFHIRGTTRDLLEQVARAYGMTAIVDDSIVSRPVRFDVQNVNFVTAMDAAMRVTKSFYVPLSARQLFFLSDTQQNRQANERMATRTFYIPEANSPQELNELMNSLRVLFDVRFIVQQPSNSTLTVRAPAQIVEAVTQFLESLSEGRPQVVFEIKAYEVSQTLTKQVGVDIPSTWGVYNVPTEAQKLLGNQNINDIINQLIASGLINQGNTTAISALIAQFLGQNSSPLLNTTLILFGGGATLSAIPVPPVNIKLSVDKSDVQNLENLQLRSGHGTPAIMKIGQRVPIINATYAPIYNSPAITKVLGNQSYRAAIPSMQYEDLGINVKATPSIRRDSEVAVDLELQLRSLSAVSLNGVPVISNREYKGVITVKDGEQIVVAGMLTKQEQRSLKGIPGLHSVPGLSQLTTLNSNNDQLTELLIVMTPHIVRMPEPSGPREIPIPVAASR